jgi:hypothetical protein
MLSKQSNDLTPEVIRQHGAEEIENLRARIVLWKEDYLRQAPPGGGEEYLFLCKDFVYEIEEYLYPYVRRLIETEHIDRDQAAEFMDFCYQQVLEVAEHLNLTTENPL